MFELEKRFNKILVVAAHPDDEILGCGGTVHALTNAGKAVRVLILAEGLTSRDSSMVNSADHLELLKKTACAANSLLGVQQVNFAGLPDNRMDSVDLLDIVKVIESEIAEFQPQLILTHHGCDLNIDHRLTQQAVLTAARPQPNSSVTTILFFETVSSTEWQASRSYGEFRPQVFVNISDSLKTKLRALEQYKGEMRPWPHARSLKSVEALANLRGASVGLDSAEAFEVGRIILK